MVGLDNQVTYLKGEVYFMKCIVLHLFELGDKFLDGELTDILKTVKSNSKQLEVLFDDAKKEEEDKKPKEGQK